MKIIIVVAIAVLFCQSLCAHSFISNSMAVDYKLDLNEGKLYLTAEAATHHFSDLLSVNPNIDPPMGEEAKKYLLPVAKKIAQYCPIKVNGKLLHPYADSISFAPEIEYLDDGVEQPVMLATIFLHYKLNEIPSRIEFNWGIMPIIPPYITEDLLMDVQHQNNDITVQLSIIDGKSEKYDFFTISEKEPQYTWHSGLLAKKPIGLEEIMQDTRTANYSIIPLAGVIFFLGTVIFMLRCMRFWRSEIYWGVAILLLCVGFMYRNQGAILVRNPLLIAQKTPKENVEKIFSKLLNDIYRAFDYSNEDDIYFTLSQCIDGKLLEKIFAQIYLSLIMKDQGGARAKIASVQIDSVDVNNPEKKAISKGIAEEFLVNCKWRIVCYVRHFNHTHRRENAYSADFKLARFKQDDNFWRITDMQINENKRIDEPNRNLQIEKQKQIDTMKQMGLDPAIINEIENPVNPAR